MSDHLVYLAVGPCGCGFAIDCDDDERARENVRRWNAQGATVERVPIEEAKDRLVFDCPHEPKYGLDWVARVEGLQAEVERLLDQWEAGIDRTVELEYAVERLTKFAEEAQAAFHALDYERGYLHATAALAGLFQPETISEEAT